MVWVELDAAEARVGGGKRCDDVPRSVTAAVLNEHDLEPAGDCLKGRHEPVGQFLQRVFGAIDWNDNGDVVHPISSGSAAGRQRPTARKRRWLLGGRPVDRWPLLERREQELPNRLRFLDVVQADRGPLTLPGKVRGAEQQIPEGR